jgi:hypothetical protein
LLLYLLLSSFSCFSTVSFVSTVLGADFLTETMTGALSGVSCLTTNTPPLELVTVNVSTPSS